MTARPASDLAAVARAADNGSPWEWEHAYPQRVTRVGDCVIVADCFEDPDAPSRFAEYIATFDPPTVLDLVARLKAAEAQVARWLAWSGGDYPDDSPGDVISADADGTIVLDDGITTWNPLRALAFKEAQVAALTQENYEQLVTVGRMAERAEAAEAALAEARTQRARMYLRLRNEREALADTRRALAEALEIAGGQATVKGVNSLAPISGLDGREIRRTLARALAATGGVTGQTHGRNCQCTPCRAEDWDEVDRRIAGGTGQEQWTCNWCGHANQHAGVICDACSKYGQPEGSTKT